MKDVYGDDITAWPQRGCQAKFKPFARGASRVIEMRNSETGEWKAFLAARVPEQLDDEIKKVRAQFFQAMEKLEPQDVQDLIPMFMPKTHVIPGVATAGIARYPVDQWIREGQLMISEKGWAKLCIRIAQNDISNLALIFEKANELVDTLADDDGVAF